MPLDTEFDAIEWQALNSWLDRRQSGTISGGISGAGTGRANALARESIDKNRKQAQERRTPDESRENIEEIKERVKKRRERERAPDITDRFGQAAQRAGRATQGTLLGVGRAILGPAGGLLTGINIASVLVIITAAVFARLSVVTEELEARRAIKRDDFFTEFGASEIAATSLDEAKARAIAAYQVFTEVFAQGLSGAAEVDTWVNAAGRYNERVQRNRSVLPHTSVMNAYRDMRADFINEIYRDNRHQGGLKKLGLNGG